MDRYLRIKKIYYLDCTYYRKTSVKAFKTAVINKILNRLHGIVLKKKRKYFEHKNKKSDFPSIFLFYELFLYIRTPQPFMAGVHVIFAGTLNHKRQFELHKLNITLKYKFKPVAKQ